MFARVVLLSIVGVAIVFLLICMRGFQRELERKQK